MGTDHNNALRCQVCGQSLFRRKGKKYCSKACQYADPSWRKFPPKISRNTCPTCGKESPRAHLIHCCRACAWKDPAYTEPHRHWLLKGQAISATPEPRERAAARMRGREQTSLATAKGPEHVCAIEFSLCTPDGQVFHGRNVRDFVRTHSFLFDPADVIWKSIGRDATCRASKGLSNLFGASKFVRYSWKGWTRKL